MLVVNIHEAKAKLSEFIAAAEAGETVQICRRNVPVVEIVALQTPQKGQRPIGLAIDPDFDIPASFFEPLPDELLKAFNGDLPDPFLDEFNPQSPAYQQAPPLYKVAEPRSESDT